MATAVTTASTSAEAYGSTVYGGQGADLIQQSGTEQASPSPGLPVTVELTSFF